MNYIELAKLLNGRQYRNETTDRIESIAKENRLVIAFGYSDDNIELRGAVHNEISAWSGGYAYFTKSGLLENECENDNCPYFELMKEKCKYINAIWSPEDMDTSWYFESEIPHEKFTIYEDKDVFCIGLVFCLDDVN